MHPVTITGTCPHCRRPVTLHEHRPTPLPRVGDIVETEAGNAVVVSRKHWRHGGGTTILLDMEPIEEVQRADHHA